MAVDTSVNHAENAQRKAVDNRITGTNNLDSSLRILLERRTINVIRMPLRRALVEAEARIKPADPTSPSQG
jgi:hypothetical protein